MPENGWQTYSKETLKDARINGHIVFLDVTADWCITCKANEVAVLETSVETPEEIIEHLEYVRKTQDIAHGFKSFVVWTFQPQTDKFPIRHVRGDEYLKLKGELVVPKSYSFVVPILLKTFHL